MDPLHELPVSRLLSLLSGGLGLQVAGAVAELGIAEVLADNPATPAELARWCNCDPTAMGRLAAAGTALGLLETWDTGQVALTSSGRVLSSDHPRSLRSFAVVQAGLMNELLSGLFHSVRTGQSADTTALGHAFYDYVRATPRYSHHWLRAMTETALIWFLDSGLLDSIDWAQRRLLIDVGGGEGGLSAELLDRFGELRAIVVDLPGVMAAAEAFLVQRNLADRATFSGWDARQAVPAGGDIYLLARVISNHGDADAQSVLRTCREAMGANSLLVIVDSIRDGPGGTLQDLLSMCIGGKARTLPEWEELLGLAGLRLAGWERGNAPPWAQLTALPDQVLT